MMLDRCVSEWRPWLFFALFTRKPRLCRERCLEQPRRGAITACSQFLFAVGFHRNSLRLLYFFHHYFDLSKTAHLWKIFHRRKLWLDTHFERRAAATLTCFHSHFLLHIAKPSPLRALGSSFWTHHCTLFHACSLRLNSFQLVAAVPTIGKLLSFFSCSSDPLICRSLFRTPCVHYTPSYYWMFTQSSEVEPLWNGRAPTRIRRRRSVISNEIQSSLRLVGGGVIIVGNPASKTRYITVVVNIWKMHLNKVSEFCCGI